MIKYPGFQPLGGLVHTKETLKTLLVNHGKIVLESPEVLNHLLVADGCAFELAEVKILDSQLIKKGLAEFRARLEYVCVHKDNGFVDTDNKIIVSVAGSATCPNSDSVWLISECEVMSCSNPHSFDEKDTDPVIPIPSFV